MPGLAIHCYLAKLATWLAIHCFLAKLDTYSRLAIHCYLAKLATYSRPAIYCYLAKLATYSRASHPLLPGKAGYLQYLLLLSASNAKYSAVDPMGWPTQTACYLAGLVPRLSFAGLAIMLIIGWAGLLAATCLGWLSCCT